MQRQQYGRKRCKFMGKNPFWIRENCCVIKKESIESTVLFFRNESLRNVPMIFHNSICAKKFYKYSKNESIIKIYTKNILFLISHSKIRLWIRLHRILMHRWHELCTINGSLCGQCAGIIAFIFMPKERATTNLVREFGCRNCDLNQTITHYWYMDRALLSWRLYANELRLAKPQYYWSSRKKVQSDNLKKKNSFFRYFW